MHVTWTNRARSDLAHVEEHIAQDNPTAALQSVLKIISAVETLPHFPTRGRIGRVSGTSELVVPDTAYLVSYRISSLSITILRVYHASRIWPQQL